jgi:hypothetical protein
MPLKKVVTIPYKPQSSVMAKYTPVSLFLADTYINPLTNPTIHLPITHAPTRLESAQPSSAYNTHILTAKASEISAFICWRCFVCQCHGSSPLPFPAPFFASGALMYAYGDVDGTGLYTRAWTESPIRPRRVAGWRGALRPWVRREVLRVSIKARETRKEMNVRGATRSCH